MSTWLKLYLHFNIKTQNSIYNERKNPECFDGCVKFSELFAISERFQMVNPSYQANQGEQQTQIRFML